MSIEKVYLVIGEFCAGGKVALAVFRELEACGEYMDRPDCNVELYNNFYIQPAKLSKNAVQRFTAEDKLTLLQLDCDEGTDRYYIFKGQ